MCMSLMRLNMCTKIQLMVLAVEWECPVKSNETKACIIDEIQNTLLERSTDIEGTDDKRDQVLYQEEKLKQQLEQSRRDIAAINGIDIASVSRMVQKFTEEEPEEFFRHFEKLAIQIKGPEIHWFVLVQGVLVGKARRTCNDLPLEKSREYTNIKETILSAYDMVPEAY